MIVLKIDKRKGEITVMGEEGKRTIKVGREQIKKIMRWDKIRIEDGEVVVEKRAKPVSIDRVIVLKKKLDKEEIRTTVYGKVEKGFLIGKLGKMRINILKEGEVIIENALIRENSIIIDKNSRVFEMRKDK